MCFGYGRLSAAKPDPTAALQEAQAKDYWQRQLEPAGIAWGERFLVVGPGHLREDRKESRLEEQPVRIVRPRLTADHASRRRRRGGDDAIDGERLRVEHRPVAGDTHEDHGIFGERGVELLPRGGTMLGKEVWVVAKPDHESLPDPPVMATLRSLPSLADVDRQTIEELAAALTAGWPVDSVVLYGSKARRRRRRG